MYAKPVSPAARVTVTVALLSEVLPTSFHHRLIRCTAVLLTGVKAVVQPAGMLAATLSPCSITQ